MQGTRLVVLLGILLTAAVATASLPCAATAGADLSQAMAARLDQEEYGATWQEKPLCPGMSACWHAPNRAQNLRFYFGADGVRAIRRTTSAPSWTWGLELIGFAGGTPPALADIVPLGQRVEYRRGALTEWYVNGERGLEQGFTVAAGPEGAQDTLAFDIATRGDLAVNLAADGESVEFLNKAGIRTITYGHLHAFDASGKDLPARMTLVAGAIRLEVDVAGAQYPVTVDPVAESSEWVVESNQSGASFGRVVATAGDINKDGLSDTIVGAPFYDSGEADEGAVFVYLGGDDGSPWMAQSNQAGAHFGAAVSTAGDINGDGYSDFLVGAPEYTQTTSHCGAVFVYAGGATSPVSPYAVYYGAHADAMFGASVAPAGDINKDSFGDIIIGSPTFENGSTDEGAAYVYMGAASGLTLIWTCEGNVAGGYYGVSVSTAGDVNNDGASEIIVGASMFSDGQANEGAAFLYAGSATGPAATPVWTAQSNAAEAFFGYSVATAGDVNGDGYSDVIIGAYAYDGAVTNSGAAFVWHGGGDYLGDNGTPANADWVEEGTQADSYFGVSVSLAGDVNSDGYADVIVGAPYMDAGLTDEGRAYVYLGTNTGLEATPSWMDDGDQAEAKYGMCVATAGDINGDGHSDVAVGAYQYDNGQTNEGRVSIYLGSTSSLGTRADWGTEGNAAGIRHDVVAIIGDVNGDGVADAAVGEPLYDGGQQDEGRVHIYYGSASGLSTSPAWTYESNVTYAQFGSAVTGAGDVNADGYADVLVGARSYIAGQVAEGGAFLFFGSAAGVSATPNWTTEGNQENAHYGSSIAGLRDVNGDGYGDIAVGAQDWHATSLAGVGKVFVYYGTATGPITTPSWVYEGGMTNEFLGGAVAGAGDVNGDGYADMIVGAHGYANGQIMEGRVYAFHGSAAGLSPVPSFIWESNGHYAIAGACVDGAGDVNGDGYADVVVGAQGYNDSGAGQGAAFIFYGASGGLSPVYTLKLGPQAESHYGTAVCGAGDVNGDGYADIAVTMPGYGDTFTNQGRAVVYHGSASGVSTHPDWEVLGPQAECWFGAQAAGGGDVTGDGFADLLVGATYYSNGELDEGKAFGFYGNGEAAPPKYLRPRQLRMSSYTNIPLTGLSEKFDRIRLSALGRTPFGRSKVKLEFELKPLGTPFDGTGTHLYGTWSNSGFVFYSTLIITPDMQYRWRIRTLYNLGITPYQPAGRWFSIPWNGDEEADFSLPSAVKVSTITPATTGPTNQDSVAFTVTFSEAVSGFDNTDVVLTQGGTSVTGIACTGGPQTYTVTLSGIAGDGNITMAISTSGGITSTVGAKPLYSSVTSAPVAIDNTSPTLTLTSYATDPTEISPIAVLASFSEPVSDFTILDVQATNANVGAFGGSGVYYGFNLAPEAVGDVTATVAAAAVHDAAGNPLFTDGVFSRFFITGNTLIVTDPGDGDALKKGSKTTIAWMAGSMVGANVRIKLYKGGLPLDTIVDSTPNTGTYSWTVASSGAAGDDYAIYVESTSNSLRNDTGDEFAIAASPITVTAPNGGESWAPGSTHAITWTWAGGSPSASVKIKLFKAGAFDRWINGGVANTGTYSWKIPVDLPIGDAYTVQVYAATDTTLVDYSDSPFSISTPPIQLTHPNGGEQFKPGDPVMITWTSLPGAADMVKIKLLKNNVVYKWIHSGTENDGVLAWTFPADAPLGADYTIQIYSATDFGKIDYSDAAFSLVDTRLRVTAPNGGEVYYPGNPMTITWNSAGSVGSQVKIKLFRNNAFDQWISGPTANDGAYTWTVPSSVTSADTYKVQVYSATDLTIKDTSDAAFWITPLQVTSPNGGETWKVGGTYNVTWSWAGNIGDTVKIKLFKNGAFYKWLNGGTPNDGSQSVKVPADTVPGTDYTVQVYSATNFSFIDVSNAPFTIEP